MMKRYQIETVAIHRYGGNLVLLDVEMKTNTRRFLMDEDGVFIPLDGKAISSALMSALAEENSSDSFDKRWVLNTNAQRPFTKNLVTWANEMSVKVGEWDWYRY